MSKKILYSYSIWEADSLKRLAEDINHGVITSKTPLRIVYVEKMEIFDRYSGRIETRYIALIEEAREYVIDWG